MNKNKELTKLDDYDIISRWSAFLYRSSDGDKILPPLKAYREILLEGLYYGSKEPPKK